MEKPYLTLIIPSYNEDDRILKTLKRVKEYLTSQNYSYEVLVVIDGATDNTFKVVSDNKSLFGDKIRIINNTKNHGKGFVVRQGMLEASGEYRVFMDADNATDVHYLESMIEKFKSGAHVVISTRDPKDAKGASQDIPQAWPKRLMGNAGNVFIQIVAVPGIWDTQNGFKGFSAKAAKDIFSRAKIDRWGFDIEALAVARYLKYKIDIIPIHWKNDPKSHVKLISYFQVLLETIKVRLNLLGGKYK